MAKITPKLQPNGTTLLTGEALLCYCHLLEAASINGSEPKFSVAVLVPKHDTETLKLLKAAIENAKKAGLEKYGAKWGQGKLKTPLRDGDSEEENKTEEFHGHYFFNANSKSKPSIVDARMNPITSTDDIYSGCFARVSVNFYPFDNSGSKGVACGLNNVQKIRDGERLGGGKTDVFQEFEALDFEADEDFDPLA